MILHIGNLPTECHITRNKKFTFNLNQYRNTHYFALNKAKRIFTQYVFDLNIQEKFTSPVQIKYDVWCRNNADMMNIGSVVDKCFQDAITVCGIIPDDNVKYVRKTQFNYKGNGKRRVDAYISEID